MKAKEALISIVVPVYKVEKYLKKCVDSILNQSYTDIEVILVDDGSPDDCGKICDEYTEKDKRVKVIHKENGGLSDARNIGLENASGDYILFIDSDDWIHEDMVDILYRNLKANDTDMSMCMFKYVFEESEEEVFDECHCTEQVEVLSSEDILRRYYSEDRVPYVVAWNKLYKKDLFKEIRYPKGKIHEDEFTSYRLIHQSDKIAVIYSALYYYLQRAGSITGGDIKAKHWDIWQAYSESKAYYRSYNQHEFINLVREKEFKEIINMYSQLYLMKNDIECQKKKKILKKRYQKMFYPMIKKSQLGLKEKVESILFRFTPEGYSFLKFLIHKMRRSVKRG